MHVWVVFLVFLFSVLDISLYRSSSLASLNQDVHVCIINIWAWTIIYILYKIWCCKSSDFWRLWDLSPPPVYHSHQVLSSHGWTTLHIWPLTPVHAPWMGLGKPNKWVSSILPLDCTILGQMQKNIMKQIVMLSALRLAQNNPDINGSKADRKKMHRERILCAIGYYPVALCAQWVF